MTVPGGLMALLLRNAAPRIVAYEGAGEEPANGAGRTHVLTLSSAEASDRLLHVFVAGVGSAPFTIDWCRHIDGAGTAGTEVITAANGNVRASVYTIPVPTGTNGNIAIGCSASILRSAAVVWSSSGVQSATALDYDSSTSSSSSMSLSTSDAGFIIMGAVNVGTGSVSWTNVTEKRDDTVESAMFYSGASIATTENSTSPSWIISSGSSSIILGASW